MSLSHGTREPKNRKLDCLPAIGFYDSAKKASTISVHNYSTRMFGESLSKSVSVRWLKKYICFVKALDLQSIGRWIDDGYIGF